MGTLDEEIELGMVEEALFGLSVAARLGSLEKAVATVFLREMDGQTGERVSLSEARCRGSSVKGASRSSGLGSPPGEGFDQDHH